MFRVHREFLLGNLIVGLPVPDLLQGLHRVVADPDVVADTQLQDQVEVIAGLGAGEQEPHELPPAGLGSDLAPDGDVE